MTMNQDVARGGLGPRGPVPDDRDYMLGLLLMGVDAIEKEGQDGIAREMRHLIMAWYTHPGLRRGELRLLPGRRKGARPR
jgi:hypothetical protein